MLVVDVVSGVDIGHMNEAVSEFADVARSLNGNRWNDSRVWALWLGLADAAFVLAAVLTAAATFAFAWLATTFIFAVGHWSTAFSALGIRIFFVHTLIITIGA